MAATWLGIEPSICDTLVQRSTSKPQGHSCTKCWGLLPHGLAHCTSPRVGMIALHGSLLSLLIMACVCMYVLSYTVFSQRIRRPSESSTLRDLACEPREERGTLWETMYQYIYTGWPESIVSPRCHGDKLPQPLSTPHTIIIIIIIMERQCLWCCHRDL